MHQDITNNVDTDEHVAIHLIYKHFDTSGFITHEHRVEVLRVLSCINKNCYKTLYKEASRFSSRMQLGDFLDDDICIPEDIIFWSDV